MGELSWIPVLLSFVLLCLAAIGVIATDNARDIVQNVENTVKETTRTVTYFRLDVNSVLNLCTDVELKQVVSKLAEDVQYSDPVSNPELVSLEMQLAQEIENLRTLVINNNTGDAIAEVDRIRNMLDDRNRRCKALK